MLRENNLWLFWSSTQRKLRYLSLCWFLLNVGVCSHHYRGAVRVDLRSYECHPGRDDSLPFRAWHAHWTSHWRHHHRPSVDLELFLATLNWIFEWSGMISFADVENLVFLEPNNVSLMPDDIDCVFRFVTLTAFFCWPWRIFLQLLLAILNFDSPILFADIENVLSIARFWQSFTRLWWRYSFPDLDVFFCWPWTLSSCRLSCSRFCLSTSS